MDWKTLFLEANGRIGQKDFWLGALILIGVGVVLGWIPFIGWLVSIGLIYCWVCLYSKRLHDFGKSGFLVLIPIVVTFAASILGVIMMGGMAALASASNDSDAAMVGGIMGFGGLMGLAMLVCLGFLLWVGLSKGEPGENRFGPAPTRSLFDSPTPPLAPPPPSAV